MPLLFLTAPTAPKRTAKDDVAVMAFIDKPVNILWIRRDGTLVAQQLVLPPKGGATA